MRFQLSHARIDLKSRFKHISFFISYLSLSLIPRFIPNYFSRLANYFSQTTDHANISAKITLIVVYVRRAGLASLVIAQKFYMVLGYV